MVESAGDTADSERRIRENFSRLRERAGWSQATLAEKLAEAGLPGMYQTTIARIEKGERSLKLAEAAIVAKVFGVDLMQLAGVAAHSAALDVQSLVHRAARSSFGRAVEEYTLELVKLAWQGDRDTPDGDWRAWFQTEIPRQTPAVMATEARIAAEAYLKRAAIKRTPMVKHLIAALKDDEKRLADNRAQAEEHPMTEADISAMDAAWEEDDGERSKAS